MGAVSSVVDTVADAVGGVVEAVGDVGSSIDDAVNDVVPGGWATVASIAVPTAAPYIVAANTLDKGGSLEDALTNAAISYGVGQIAQNIGAPEAGSLDAGPGAYDISEYLTPQATAQTLPISAQDPFAYTPPTEPLPITAQDPFGYTPPAPTDVVGDYFNPAKQVSSLGIKDALNLANLGMTAASILNTPDTNMGGTGATGYDLQPIPEGWKPPVYQTEFTPIDLASIFQGADLTGTQWANQMQPVQFAPAPTMQDLTNILQGIDFGQTAIGNQSVKG
jgi:hypothetical protein